MENLFIDILEITLPISAWIAILLLCSPLLKRSYVAKWRYFMWLFVAARLVLPFRAHSPIQMEIPSEISAIGTAVRSTVQSTVHNTFPVWRVLTMIWLAGMTVCTVYQIISYHSFKRLVRRWSKPVSDTEIIHTFNKVKELVRVRKSVKLRLCKAVRTPMVIGIAKPVLLLPYIDFADEELPIIFRHELVHLKRHDIWYKLLLMAARIIHWFNPLVHIMVKAADRDMELACDAEVVRSEDSAFKKHYCEAIMRLVHNGRGAETALSTCFIFSKKTMLERFKNILDDKIKRSGAIMFCVVALSVGISGGAVSFATEQVAQEVEDKLHIVERPTPAPAAEPTMSPTSAPTEKPVNTKKAYQGTSSKPAASRTETASRQTYGSSDDADTDENADISLTASDALRTVSDTPKTAPDAVHSDPETSQKAVSETGTGTGDDIGEVEKGTGRGSVYEQIGTPDSVSDNGSRETYSLSDGSTAVVQYNGDVLDAGYILVE